MSKIQKEVKVIFLAILKAISQDSARFEILSEECQTLGDSLIDLNGSLPGENLLKTAYCGQHLKVELKSKTLPLIITQIYPLK